MTKDKKIELLTGALKQFVEAMDNCADWPDTSKEIADLVEAKCYSQELLSEIEK